MQSDTCHARPIADGVLSRCGCDTDTALRTRVLKYLVQHEFTPETERLIADPARARADPRHFPRYSHQAVPLAYCERVRRFYIDTLGFVLHHDAGASACCPVLDDQMLPYLDGTDARTPLAYCKTRPRFMLPKSTTMLLDQRLRAAGIACTPDTPPDPRSLYHDFEFRDPTGNRSEAIGLPERSR